MLNVRLPESSLQRHEAIVRVIREKQRMKLLLGSFFFWNTSLTLQLFLRVGHYFFEK